VSSRHNAIQGDFGEAWLEVVASGCGLLRGRSTLDLEKTDLDLTYRSRQQTPSLAAVAEYLRASGWSLVDEDSRTSLWRPNRDFPE